MEYLLEILGFGSAAVGAVWVFIVQKKLTSQEHRFQEKLAAKEHENMTLIEEGRATAELAATRETEGVRVQTEVQQQVFEQASALLTEYKEDREDFLQRIGDLEEVVEELKEQNRDLSSELNAMEDLYSAVIEERDRDQSIIVRLKTKIEDIKISAEGDDCQEKVIRTVEDRDRLARLYLVMKERYEKAFPSKEDEESPAEEPFDLPPVEPSSPRRRRRTREE